MSRLQDRPLDEEDRRVVEQVEKLYRVAARAATPEEAAAFTNKALELLAKHNLAASDVERQRGVVTGKREEQKLHGGAHEWQKRVWEAVATLNFCLYFNVKEWRTRPGSSKVRLRAGHRLVGRVSNVATATVMAQYLEDAVERLAKEWFVAESSSWYTPDKMAFREGAADTIVLKLYDKREAMIQAEQSERAEIAERLVAAGLERGSTALTLTTLTQQEYDANVDHLYGEGWSAKQRAARAERARAREEADRLAAEWAAANPEAARRAEEERQAESEKWRKENRGRHRSYRPSASEQRRGSAAYYDGRDAAQKISVDDQAGGAASKRIAG
jgi:hypothetical protein